MTIDGADLALGAIWYIALLFSVVLHEAAHAWAAWNLGDPTAYRGGQVTLDPLPHIRRAPLGMVVVPWLSFLALGWMLGWASAPYNALWAQRFPKRAAVMALAGPAANLALVVIAALAIRGGITAGWFEVPECPGILRTVSVDAAGPVSSLGVFLNIALTLNLLLFVFNLFPVPPLDGAAIVPLFLSDANGRAYLRVLGHPVYSVLGLVLACVAFPHVFDFIHSALLTALYAGAI